jgi:putative membrane protein
VLPAFAADTAPTTPDAKTEAAPATTGSLFTENQARVHLAHLGYTSISELKKDQNGVWHGSATKDGKARVVAVDIKGTVRN